MARSTWMLLTMLAPVLLAGVTDAPAEGGFVRLRPGELHWTDIPAGLGAQVAVIAGNPQVPGLYVVRVRFPPHVMDPPHWHPNVRYVTVLKGTWYAGTGTEFDPAQAVPLGAGNVMIHPARVPHWDGSATDEEAIVQIVGEGPGTSTPTDPSAPGWVRVAR